MSAPEFRRINDLPPYVFTVIDQLKLQARRNNVDVIDLGFGNPDIPSPDIAVDKVAEAARRHHLVPAQPDDDMRRPRLDAAHGRLRARARDRPRPRLRLFGYVL